MARLDGNQNILYNKAKIKRQELMAVAAGENESHHYK
jgi:hypothetical protein